MKWLDAKTADVGARLRDVGASRSSSIATTSPASAASCSGVIPVTSDLVAVFQGAGADWRQRTHDRESPVYVRRGFSDERQRALDDARQRRLQDVIPPTMMKLYSLLGEHADGRPHLL